jgi:hypothetical protein
VFAGVPVTEINQRKESSMSRHTCDCGRVNCQFPDCWKLIDDKGNQLKVGMTVNTFRGEQVTLTGMRPPHKAGSSGHVTVTFKDGGEFAEFYAGVINAHYEKEPS